MATTDIIPSVDLLKQSSDQNSCSRVCNIRQSHKRILPLEQIFNPEKLVHQKKYTLNESESIRQARLRSLSHWPHLNPSKALMSSTGWFSCNINDRVICIYCNTICHQWRSDDDPCEVHARLAPQCPFVLSMPPIQRSPKIINETMNVKLQPCHPTMIEISRRQTTFSNSIWTATSPSVDDLVRAGFFFTGVSNTVTCFYCNGSLHRWGATDNPMIEHARWFPSCIYAKHLCGDTLYGQIQALKKQTPTENRMETIDLNRWVAARLDLPIAERLRSQYSLGVIKRCLEDQFNIKHDDFTSDTDLTIACLILKKQIDIIKGCKDKIITPSKHQQSTTSKESARQSLGECLICLTEEKQLACMPCGHLCACVSCGYALRSCPVCREKIQCFIRING